MNITSQIQHNSISAYLALAKHAPGFRILETGAYTMVTSEFQHPIGNFVVSLNLDDSAIIELAAIAKRNAPLRIHQFPDDKPLDLSYRLADRGIVEHYSLLMMVQPHPWVSDGPELHRATREQTSMVMQFVFENFFWMTPPAMRSTLRFVLESMAKTEGEHYFIQQDDEIVAAASLLETGSIGGIYNVCVHQRHRGRGIGRGLVSSIADIASLKRLKPALQAEPGLEGFYSALGFDTVGRIRVFGAPEARKPAR